VAIGLVAGGATWICAAWRVDKPGPLFFVLVRAISTIAPGGIADVPLHAGVAAMGAAIGWARGRYGRGLARGVVAGAFRFHGDLGRMPMAEVMEPALEAARRGVAVAPLQAYVARLLAPILDDTEGIRRIFRPGGRLLEEGDVHRLPELAGFLEVLAREGEDLFYRGEVAESVDRAFRAGGGHLRREDFESYRVEVRDPLEVSYGGRLVRTNPPPASGGLLIGFGLQVLGGRPPGSRPDGPAEATRIARALTAMREARREEGLDEGVDPAAARRLHEVSLGVGHANVVHEHARAPTRHADRDRLAVSHRHHEYARGGSFVRSSPSHLGFRVFGPMVER
jgi:gamma-glutamyltranspeptidase